QSDDRRQGAAGGVAEGGGDWRRGERERHLQALGARGRQSQDRRQGPDRSRVLHADAGCRVEGVRRRSTALRVELAGERHLREVRDGLHTRVGVREGERRRRACESFRQERGRSVWADIGQASSLSLARDRLEACPTQYPTATPSLRYSLPPWST